MREHRTDDILNDILSSVLENGRVVQDGTAREIAEDAGIQDYYLGGRSGKRRSYRDVAVAGLEVGS